MVRVVLYDRMVNIWAARVWWMLRAFGLPTPPYWTADGPSGQPKDGQHRPRRLPIQPPSSWLDFQPERIATKEEVQAAISHDSTCLINALDPEEFSGRGPVRYGRPGHIPSSVNVSFLGVLNSETNAYLPLEDIRAQFASAGVSEKTESSLTVEAGSRPAATPSS